jgi:hypothetical protein
MTTFGAVRLCARGSGPSRGAKRERYQKTIQVPVTITSSTGKTLWRAQVSPAHIGPVSMGVSDAVCKVLIFEIYPREG